MIIALYRAVPVIVIAELIVMDIWRRSQMKGVVVNQLINLSGRNVGQLEGTNIGIIVDKFKKKVGTRRSKDKLIILSAKHVSCQMRPMNKWRRG